MRRRHDRGVRGKSHAVELAPMLDFVVSLAVFFVFAAVFVRESGIVVGGPSRDDDASPAQDIRKPDREIDDRDIDVRVARANLDKTSVVHGG